MDTDMEIVTIQQETCFIFCSSPAPKLRLKDNASPLFIPNAKFVISPYSAKLLQSVRVRDLPEHVRQLQYPPDYKTAVADFQKTVAAQILIQAGRISPCHIQHTAFFICFHRNPCSFNLYSETDPTLRHLRFRLL